MAFEQLRQQVLATFGVDLNRHVRVASRITSLLLREDFIKEEEKHHATMDFLDHLLRMSGIPVRDGQILVNPQQTNECVTLPSTPPPPPSSIPEEPILECKRSDSGDTIPLTPTNSTTTPIDVD